MRAMVWYDDAGRIVAVGHAVGGAEATACASTGGGTLIVDLDEDVLATLHEDHAVDTSKARLVRRRDPPRPR